MSSLFLNGVYDLNLIKSIKASGVQWGVDFRARSSQFLPFHQFKEIVQHLSPVDLILIHFEEEKLETMLSFINLIQAENIKSRWNLVFRDNRPAHFYQQLNCHFSWFYHASSDWREILTLDKLDRVIVPVVVAGELSDDFWDIVENRNLEVVLHFYSFQELFSFKNINRDVSLSVDLTAEVESSYRRPNHILIQTYLRSLEERKKLGEINESPAGQ